MPVLDSITSIFSKDKDKDKKKHKSDQDLRRRSQLSQLDIPPSYSTVDVRGRLSVPASPSHSRSSSTASRTSYRGKLDRDYLRRPIRQESLADTLTILKGYDTVVLVDDSGSMEGDLWVEAGRALGELAAFAMMYDENGIDIHFLNAQSESACNVKDLDQVQKLFRRVSPVGLTPTGRRLEMLLQEYITALEKADDAGRRNSVKPVNIIVITDGAPSDAPDAVIAANAKRLDERHFPLCQVGIQFVQIGNAKGAAKALKELDDSLSSQYNVRDIVDTVPYIGKLQGEVLVKVMVGAINRKQDLETPKALRKRR